MNKYILFLQIGQKIAKILCTQISKETRRIKSLLEECNACQVIDGAGEMSLTDALDPENSTKVI